MALQLGNNGELRLVLRVKDDGSVVVEKFADTADRSAKKSSKAFDDFASGAGISFRSMATYAGIAAAAIVAGGAAMVKVQIDVADATGKAAGKLGTTTEALSALAHQADSTANMSLDNVSQAVIVMSRNLSDATQGAGDARFAIMDLGLDAQKLAQMKPEDAIKAIADQLDKVPNKMDKLRIANDIFRNSDMVNVLRGGASAMREFYIEAEKAGKIVQEDTAKAAIEFNDNVTRLRNNLQGMAASIMKEVVPALVRLTDAMLGKDNLESLIRKRAELAVKYQSILQSPIIGGLAGATLENLRKEIDDIDARIVAANRKLSEQQAAAAAASSAGVAGAPAGRGSRELQAAMEEAAKSGQAIAEAQAQFRQAAIEATRARAEDLRASLMTEEELERQSYEQRIAALYEANQTIIEIDAEGNMARLISDEEFKRMREQIEIEHQARLGDATAQGVLERQKLERMTATQQAQFYAGHLQQITQASAAHNKTLFRLNQIAGASNAFIAGKEGAAKALKWGWPMGPIFAGIIWAAAAANIAAITSAQFGSSTSAPSVAGGGAIPVETVGGSPPAVTPFQSSQSDQGQPIIQVIVQGNIIGNEQYIDDLARGIRDRIDNRDLLLFGGRSRQAREIVEAV